MKKIIHLTLMLGLAIALKAQSTRHASFSVCFGDSSNTLFFTENPTIRTVSVKYTDRVPTDVFIHHEGLKGDKLETHYDLKFQGDLYVLQTTYTTINLPMYPNIQTGYLGAVSTLPKHAEITARLKKDSLIYDVDVYTLEGEESSLFSEKFAAHYIGGDLKLKEDLVKSYRNYEVTGWSMPQDSVLLFRGVVHPRGNISNVELVSGRPSKFSEFVKRHFQQDNDLWQPELQGGRRVKSTVGIFIRIRDGEIISVSGSGSSGTPRYQ